MDRDEAVEVLERHYQVTCMVGEIGVALTLAIETLKRIDSDKIRGVMGINCESYPADEYKMADAIVNYLEEKL